MRIDRQGPLQAAGRQARRVRRITGRILFGAVGFGAAYYLDPQSGRARRDRLRVVLRECTRAGDVDVHAAIDRVGPPPVMTPLLRELGLAHDDPGSLHRVDAR